MIKANRKQLDIMLAEMAGLTRTKYKRHHQHGWCYKDSNGDEVDWHPTTHENGIVQLLDMLEDLGVYYEVKWGYHMTGKNLGEGNDGYRVSIWTNGTDHDCIGYHPDLRIAIALCLLRADGKEVEFEE